MSEQVSEHSIRLSFKRNNNLPNGRKEKYPVILIIAGTGKADRDGNVKRLKFNIYKDLAEFFTKIGFATLRYDKRGTHKSEGNFYQVGVNDLIEDACACVQFLQNHPRMDHEKILILGHSEGALIAPAVHKKTPVSGLILLAGAAEPTATLFPRQREMAYKEMNAAKGVKGWLFRTLNVVEKAQNRNEKALEKINASDQAVMRISGMKMNAKWIREALQFNTVEYLKEVTCPVLAITGEKDVQVPPSHAQKIAELVQGEAEWHIIPHMNHIFRKYPGDHTMMNLMKEYKSLLNEPIDQDLLDTIEAWLLRTFR